MLRQDCLYLRTKWFINSAGTTRGMQSPGCCSEQDRRYKFFLITLAITIRISVTLALFSQKYLGSDSGSFSAHPWACLPFVTSIIVELFSLNIIV
jgi:hypothetical protein